MCGAWPNFMEATMNYTQHFMSTSRSRRMCTIIPCLNAAARVCVSYNFSYFECCISLGLEYYKRGTDLYLDGMKGAHREKKTRPRISIKYHKIYVHKKLNA